jgi:hypothetical protein
MEYNCGLKGAGVGVGVGVGVPVGIGVGVGKPVSVGVGVAEGSAEATVAACKTNWLPFALPRAKLVTEGNKISAPTVSAIRDFFHLNDLGLTTSQA